MLQNSVFRQRMTMRRQISAVRAVRIAFLLNLFASVVGHDLSRLSPVCWSYFVALERLYVLTKEGVT